jgi:hypothetical protein
MAQLLKASRVVRVPLEAVVDPSSIVLQPTVGHQLGDPWVDIAPGAEVDVTKWPESRTCISRTRGKGPETIIGLGKQILDKLRDRGALIPAAQELAPDPAIGRTVVDSEIFDKNGRARTMEIRRPDDEPEKPARTKKGGK